jgi:putative addiction module component (TIGR02574 family)
MSLTLEQFGIERLSILDRLVLIGLIWDSVTDAVPGAPVPEWHLEEVARRRAAAEADPNAARPWDGVRARLLDRQ